MEWEKKEEERDLQRWLIFEQIHNRNFDLQFGDDEDYANENVSIVEDDEDSPEQAKQKAIENVIAVIEHNLED